MPFCRDCHDENYKVSISVMIAEVKKRGRESRLEYRNRMVICAKPALVSEVFEAMILFGM